MQPVLPFSPLTVYPMSNVRGSTNRSYASQTFRCGPITKIPVEILSKIFTYLVPTIPWGDVPCEAWQFTDWNYLRTVRSTCYLWRYVADHTPSAWTHVCPRSMPREMIPHFLARSGDLSLDVYLFVEPDDEDLVKILAQHARRFRMLAITTMGDGYRSLQSLLPFETCDAPRLQHFLQLPYGEDWTKMDMDDEEEDEDEEEPQEPVLPRLFKGTLPSLHSVYLSDIHTWPSGVFRNLSQFTLIRSQDTELEFRMEPALEVLRASPDIRSVLFLEAFNDYGEVVSPTPVVLKKLESLHIEGEGVKLREFLSHVVVPSTTHLEIDACLADGAHQGVPPLTCVLPRELNPLHHITRLRIAGGRDEILIEGYGGGPQDHTPPLLQLTLRATWIDPDVQVQATIDQALRNLAPLPLDRIHEVTLQTTNFFTTEAWFTFFKRLPALRALNIEGFPATEVLDALVPTDTVKPCINLKALRFCSSEVPTELRALHALVAARERRGCPVEELTVVRPLLPGTRRSRSNSSLDLFSKDNFCRTLAPFVQGTIKLVDTTPVVHMDDYRGVWWQDVAVTTA